MADAPSNVGSDSLTVNTVSVTESETDSADNSNSSKLAVSENTDRKECSPDSSSKFKSENKLSGRSGSGLPNGFISHGDASADQKSCVCEDRKEPGEILSNKCETSTTTLSLPENSQETAKRQNELTDSADSGVHSGTDNGSDRKSSSSSPGLSTESSIQDLSEKDDLKKCDSNEPLDREKSKENLINELAESMSNTVSISQNELNPVCDSPDEDYENGIEYVVYQSEAQMPDIMRLITKDLSEPYSIYTYRYFIHNWPKLCFLAKDTNSSECVGAIVCKLDMHKKMVRRGYIAMLAIDQKHRRKRIGSHLVLKAIRAMIADDCDEVVLETEITNQAALRLYENLGFVRDKRLFRYYLNGVDALRLKLWLR